jgi:hypothetical protein
MAVGYGDTGAVSVNGFIWTTIDLTYDINWKSVCFGNGFFVVVGYDTTSIRTSDNGVNFYSSSLPVYQSWNSVCFGNGNFVTVGDSSTGAWSDDNASTWHTSTLPHNVPWSSVNYGDGCFVAISVDGFVAISTDKGKTWIKAHGSTVGFGFYSDPSSLGAKSFLITTNNLNTSAPALSLLTDGSGWVGVAGVVYPTCALDVGSGNVSALKFIGDGSLLTNLPNSFIQPLANLAVSNSLTTTNVFASTETLTGTSGRTTLGVTGNVYVSNALSTTNVFASTETLTGTSGRTTLGVTGNVYVSNALSTTNVFVTGNVVIGRNITALQAGFGTTAPTANLHVVGNVYVTSNLSIGGSATVASDTFTAPFGTFGTLGILSGVTVGASSTVLGSNLAVFSNISGGSNMLVFNSSAQLGLGTPNPTSTLHVVGNVFASNAISTVNILANTLTLSNTTSRITVTGNIYASNAISTTNLIASNTLTVGTATLGSNIAIFSNVSGGSNVVVISSNSYVGIGLTNPTYQLDLSTDNARKATSSTWATVSDIRVKTDIESANLFTCYNNVKNIELKYFKWNYPDVEVSDSHMLGYIAQEVAEYFPNSVKVTDSHGFPDFLSLDTDQILKSMYGALQKTIEDKEALEEKLELAQNDIDLLETRLSDLEALVRTLLPSKEDQVSSGPRSAALMNQM